MHSKKGAYRLDASVFLSSLTMVELYTVYTNSLRYRLVVFTLKRIQGNSNMWPRHYLSLHDFDCSFYYNKFIILQKSLQKLTNRILWIYLLLLLPSKIYNHKNVPGKSRRIWTTRSIGKRRWSRILSRWWVQYSHRSSGFSGRTVFPWYTTAWWPASFLRLHIWSGVPENMLDSGLWLFLLGECMVYWLLYLQINFNFSFKE